MLYDISYDLIELDDFECSICLESKIYQKESCKLSCNHKFHTECINSWLCKDSLSSECPQCPLCRGKIKKIKSKFNEKETVIIEKIKLFLQEQKLSSPNNFYQIINFLNNGYVYMKLNDNPYLMVNDKIIRLFLFEYIKIEQIELYVEYTKNILLNGYSLFGLEKNTNSKKINLLIENIPISTTIAQAHFLCWFYSNNLMEKLIQIFVKY